MLVAIGTARMKMTEKISVDMTSPYQNLSGLSMA